MILELFMRHCEGTFSRSAILNQLWEMDKVITADNKTDRLRREDS